MSETSSPSVHIHPVSPSSSLSSADSGLQSELTSDEEPDLGAFTTVLREWTHLQPPPRIPVQIRSATSSTTPTFQPSVTGSEAQSTFSRNSRVTAQSAVSSFTRPPSSSAHPEGSTVWAQAPIASYLYSQTPSNDDEEGESYGSLEAEGEYGEYTPNSMASSGLTVEIVSDTEFEQSNAPVPPSPYPDPSDSGISLPLTLESDNNRLDSRETAHPEEGMHTSETSRGRPFTTTSTSQADSLLTSVQLQSQNRPTPTEDMVSAKATAPSATGLSASVSGSPLSLNRSRNPEPPRTKSDSSFTGSASSSSLSLVSYQISETVSVPSSEEEPPTNVPMSTSGASSVALKTQRSVVSSLSESTTSFGTQRPHHYPTVPITLSSSLSSTGSPLPNPHSPLPPPERAIPVAISDTRRRMLGTTSWRLDDVVNDMGTPDQPPSETLLFDPQTNWRSSLRSVVDDDEEEVIRVERNGAPALHEQNQYGSVVDSNSIYERPGPLIHSLGSVYPQRRVNSQRTERRELYDEDEEEAYHPTPYSYSSGPAPRIIGPALTPRGIPPAPAQFPNLSTFQAPGAAVTNSSAPSSGYYHPLLTSQNTQTQRIEPQSQIQYQPESQYAAPAVTHPQSTNSYVQHTLNAYTPRGLPIQQSSGAINLPYQSHSMSSSQSSFSVTSDDTTPISVNNAHGYPYSLLGLHALPASYSSHGTSTLPSVSSTESDDGTSTSQIQGPSEVSDDNSTIYADARREQIDSENILLEQAVPSLGVLDGVLSFIAVERERARNNAVREGPTPASTSETDEVHTISPGEDDRQEDIGETGEGEEQWKHIVGNDQDPPKRKRRRKRPPRSHAHAVTANPSSVPSGEEIPGGARTPNANAYEAVDPSTITGSATISPKKKKKIKSTTNSVTGSASGSVVSLHGDGFITPTMTWSRDKDFLVPPATLSRSTSKSQKKDPQQVRILQRPARAGSDDDNDSVVDGGRTPTNLNEVEGGQYILGGVTGSAINMVGTNGKRVGRRERESEKLRYDTLGRDGGEAGREGDVGIESLISAYSNDNDGGERGGLAPREYDDDHGEDNDSLSNLTILKPPRNRSRRRRAKDTINTMAGITGTPTSTISSPGQVKDPDEVQTGDVGLEQRLDGTVENEGPQSSSFSSPPEKRKRTRSRRLKPAPPIPDFPLDVETGGMGTLTMAPPVSVSKITAGRARAAEMLGRSDFMDTDRSELQKYLFASGSGIVLMNTRPEKVEKPGPPPNSKKGRIIALAKQLRELFPEQREDLGKVISRLERPNPNTKKVKSGDDAEGTASKPVNIPGSKRKRTRKGHLRVGSEGASASGEGIDMDDDQAEDENVDGAPDEEEEEEVDPRGRAVRRGDALVHVFIDHSNIHIGLLSHLKRSQTYRRNAAKKVQSRPLPAIISRAIAMSKANNQNDAASSAFAAVKSTASRPLPTPSDANALSQGQDPADASQSIPLPSFATMSHSLPTTSALSSHMKSTRSGALSDDAVTSQVEREANSDGNEYPAAGNDESGGTDDAFDGATPNKKKYPKHLWHAALALILERGRPVTRRVVVTSSPLYQPMDAIERLGYELRVFIRVPDYGDGQDRDRHKDKDKNTFPKSSGGKSAQSSPVAITTSSGLPSEKNSGGHTRQFSSNSGTESGSGGGAGSAHPFYGTPNNSSQSKVKYREQGVDELLQLKLHQALAATDHVPEGSTIVLATGDGNVSQFNDDGFLGPVRTALRRGWRVELYAWEDGLSRAWRREFGEGSEWGRRGLFRVIAMEQFADALVEAIQ